MAITLIDSDVGNAVDGGAVVLSFTGAAQNDVVLVFGAHIESADPSGYTNLVDSAPGTGRYNCRASAKIMGSTPDTSVTCPTSLSTTAMGAVCYVLRGVDVSGGVAGILDQTPVIAYGNGSPLTVDFGAIVTQTAGAWVFALGGVQANTLVSAAPAGYSNLLAGTASDTFGNSLGAASKAIASPGSEEPGAFGSQWNGQTVWTAVTLAIKPAAAAPAAEGNFTFNVAKGRVGGLYDRVDAADPPNCALVLVVLDPVGLETDAVLKKKATLADVLSGSTSEVTNAGYARKVLVAADLTALAPDHTNDRVDIVLPNQTWPTVSTGSGWAKLLVCFRPDPASADSAIIPLTAHGFVRTPNGTDLGAVLSGGICRVA